MNDKERYFLCSVKCEFCGAPEGYACFFTQWSSQIHARRIMRVALSDKEYYRQYGLSDLYRDTHSPTYGGRRRREIRDEQRVSDMRQVIPIMRFAIENGIGEYGSD